MRNTAEDVRGNSFTTELSQQEIAELPEDPDELQQVLEQMAGPGATMRVNGFTGGRLPPKSQIRSIRFRQNSFDAEYHEGGGFGIDIVTKPGMTGWKGMSSFGFRDDSLNARNAFAPTNQPMQYRRFGLNADGPVVKGKTSIAFDLEGNNSYDSATINALTPDGQISELARTPQDRMFGSVRLDHSISKNQQLLVEFQRNYIKNENLGVGGFNLDSRGYTSETSDSALRLALNGLLAPKVAHELKVRFEVGDATLTSNSLDPAIIVQQTFNSGGAGQNSNNHSKTLEFADNIDWSARQEARVSRGPARRGRLVSHERPDELQRHVHVRRHRAVQPRAADDVHAAHGERGARLRLLSARPLRPGHVDANQARLGQPRPARGVPVAPRRLRELRAAHRHDDSGRQVHRFAAATGSSTTGTTRATTRRCCA